MDNEAMEYSRPAVHDVDRADEVPPPVGGTDDEPPPLEACDDESTPNERVYEITVPGRAEVCASSMAKEPLLCREMTHDEVRDFMVSRFEHMMSNDTAGPASAGRSFEMDKEEYERLLKENSIKLSGAVHEAKTSGKSVFFEVVSSNPDFSANLLARASIGTAGTPSSAAPVHGVPSSTPPTYTDPEFVRNYLGAPRPSGPNAANPPGSYTAFFVMFFKNRFPSLDHAQLNTLGALYDDLLNRTLSERYFNSPFVCFNAALKSARELHIDNVPTREDPFGTPAA